MVGEDFKRWNSTTQVVFDVVRSGGAFSLRALTDQQIYDSIAYELSLNDVELTEPLDAQSAVAGTQKTNALFPPPGDAELISTSPDTSLQGALDLPLSAENGGFRLRLSQVALAVSIGGKVAPSMGSYVLMVLTFEDLADEPSK